MLNVKIPVTQAQEKTTFDPAAYQLASQLAELVSDWLDHGYHLRDASGQVIVTLDEWEAAARAGQWVARLLDGKENPCEERKN